MDTFVNSEEFGEELKKLIKKTPGVNISEVAAAVGIHYGNLSNRLKNNRMMVHELEMVANHMKLPFSVRLGPIITKNETYEGEVEKEELIKENELQKQLIDSLKEINTLREELVEYKTKEK